MSFLPSKRAVDVQAVRHLPGQLGFTTLVFKFSFGVMVPSLTADTPMGGTPLPPVALRDEQSGMKQKSGTGPHRLVQPRAGGLVHALVRPLLGTHGFRVLICSLYFAVLHFLGFGFSFLSLLVPCSSSPDSVCPGAATADEALKVRPRQKDAAADPRQGQFSPLLQPP